MTRRQLAVAAVLTIFTALPASAQDRPEFGTDRESAAKAAAAGERARALEAEVASLKAEVAELTAGRDAALKLVEITEKILAAQARLAQLADQERDAYKAKAERLEKEKGKGQGGRDLVRGKARQGNPERRARGRAMLARAAAAPVVEV